MANHFLKGAFLWLITGVPTKLKKQYKYINERTFMILGSSGLLYIDDILGLSEVIKHDECVIINKNYIPQIVNILDNYQDYYLTRYKGHQRVINNHTLDYWASYIKKKIDL